MKTHYKKVQTTSLFLSLIFLFQSCHVYHKIPISLDEAVTANKRMKVITTDNKKHKFLKIEKTDSTYYGHTEVRNHTVKVPLQKEKIQNIRPINKEASTVVTIGAVLIPIGILIAVIIGTANSTWGSPSSGDLGTL